MPGFSVFSKQSWKSSRSVKATSFAIFGFSLIMHAMDLM